MEHEIRYYLKQIKKAMQKVDGATPFVPQSIVTAVKLQSGAIEIAINNTAIEDKIDYILEAYDDDMRLKANSDIVMQNIMVV